MESVARKTVSHATIYAVGTVVRYSASFLMLPIYTHYLLPRDYGVVELLQMIVDLMAIFTGMRVGEAIMRYYYKFADVRERARVVGTALALTGSFNLVAMLAVIALAEPLSAALFGSIDYARLLALFSVNLLVVGASEVVMTFIVAQQRPVIYMGLSLLRMFMQLGLNILFLVGMGLKVEGVVYASLISSLTYMAILLGYAGYHGAYRMSGDMARVLMKFSWPMVIAGFGEFYLTFGDRYVLRLFHGLAEVGIYSLGYKFGFLLIVFGWRPFHLIWNSVRYQISERPDAKDVYQRVFVVASLSVVTCALMLAMLCDEVLDVMSATAFHPAARVAPVILIAYVIQAWTQFCRFGLLLKERTVHITWATAIGAGVTTLGFFLLIPRFGSMGAAWGTVAAFSARLWWVQRQAEHAFRMDLPWRRVAVICALAIGMYGLSNFAPHELIAAVAVQCGLGLVFVVGVWFSGLVRAREKALVLRAARDLVPLQWLRGARAT